jgi:hypothetical protein
MERGRIMRWGSFVRVLWRALRDYSTSVLIRRTGYTTWEMKMKMKMMTISRTCWAKWMFLWF